MIDIVDFITIPNTKRECTVIIKCGDDKLLCINMYMPVDNQRKTHIRLSSPYGLYRNIYSELWYYNSSHGGIYELGS